MSTEQPVTGIGETDPNQPSNNNQTATDDSTAEMTASSSDSNESDLGGGGGNRLRQRPTRRRHGPAKMNRARPAKTSVACSINLSRSNQLSRKAK
jgi:hypothetical protein